jgi:hypothetical protein
MNLHQDLLALWVREHDRPQAECATFRSFLKNET